MVPWTSFAKSEMKTVSYNDGEVELEGSLAVSKKGGKGRLKPAVLIVHDWMGHGEFSKGRAKAISELGYIGFAVDIYGKGTRPGDGAAAGKLSSQYKAGDRASYRSRLKAAFDYLVKQPGVDPERIAIMGYCFGGTGALEAARMGLPIKGAISFHGGLSAPTSSETKPIKAKVLVLHGAIDPYVKPDEVASFQKEMNDGGVDYQFVAYSGAVHAFTNPGAGSDISKGAAYNASADKRSWIAMKNFLAEIF